MKSLNFSKIRTAAFKCAAKTAAIKVANTVFLCIAAAYAVIFMIHAIDGEYDKASIAIIFASLSALVAALFSANTDKS